MNLYAEKTLTERRDFRPAKVDCTWAPWTICSEACNGGTRTRKITQPAENNGQECDGNTQEDCNVEKCTGTIDFTQHSNTPKRIHL